MPTLFGQRPIDVAALLTWQVLVGMGLLMSETVDIVDSFRWPDTTGSQQCCSSTAAGPLRLLLNVARDGSGRSVLHAAAAAGLVELLTALLLAEPSGQAPSLLHLKDQNGRTALHAAAGQRNHTIVQLLLDHGAAIDALDESDTSPLMIAAADAPVACLTTLIAMGAKCDTSSMAAGTALHWACAAGRSDTVRLLLQSEPKLLDMPDASGNTPLVLAAAQGLAGTLRLLVEAGADINKRIDGCPSMGGGTILHILADGGDLACINALLKSTKAGHEADIRRLVTTETEHGMHAASIAALAGHVDAARLILAVPGADAHMDGMQRARVRCLVNQTMTDDSIEEISPALAAEADTVFAEAGNRTAAMASLRRVLCNGSAGRRTGLLWHQLAQWELAAGEAGEAVQNAEVATRVLRREHGRGDDQCPEAARAELMRAEALIAVRPRAAGI